MFSHPYNVLQYQVCTYNSIGAMSKETTNSAGRSSISSKLYLQAAALNRAYFTVCMYVLVSFLCFVLSSFALCLTRFLRCSHKKTNRTRTYLVRYCCSQCLQDYCRDSMLRFPLYFLGVDTATRTYQVYIYKALRSADGLRRPLRSLRKEKYIKLLCEADRGP